MPRSNSSVPRHKRHKKIIKSAKGYFGTRKSNYRTAKDAVQKSLQYSYRDRRNRKRDFRVIPRGSLRDPGEFWNITVEKLHFVLTRM